MLEVGRLRVVPVSDGLARLPPGYFGNVDWRRHRALLGPDGTLDLPIGTFLVHGNGRTVLVDAGVAPEAVDLVICTHLHMDHVGWLLADGAPSSRAPPCGSAPATGTTS